MEELKKCKHKFNAIKKTASNSEEWIVVYCENCGLVSFDQAKQGVNDDYQKCLRRLVDSA